jgi:hypothetical protein
MANKSKYGTKVQKPRPVGRERRGGNRSGILVNTEYDADELEFIKAMDRYKREKKRPFPAWSEVLGVLKKLGWRKVEDGA